MPQYNKKGRQDHLYPKVQPHGADVLTQVMQEKGMDAAALAAASGVDEGIISDLMTRDKTFSYILSEKLAVALGVGKQRFYKAHLAWMDSGGT